MDKCLLFIYLFIFQGVVSLYQAWTRSTSPHRSSWQTIVPLGMLLGRTGTGRGHGLLGISSWETGAGLEESGGAEHELVAPSPPLLC